MRTQLPDLLHGEGEKKKVEVSNQTFLEQRKLARKWTCLYLTYDFLQNHFYTHFFLSRYAIIAGSKEHQRTERGKNLNLQ